MKGLPKSLIHCFSLGVFFRGFLEILFLEVEEREARGNGTSLPENYPSPYTSAIDTLLSSILYKV